MISRRRFLNSLGMVAAGTSVIPRFRAEPMRGVLAIHSAGQGKKAYGSGYFGEWVEDEFGLPAYHYTCNQVSDPKAISPVNKEVRSPTDQIHQVGNDRLVAVASNYGYVQVRQDEGSPKFLNDYAPERGQFGGGIGYLSDGPSVLSTYYPGNAKTFERFFGVGYFRKKVANGDYSLDQVIFAPFGDDPLLLSQVTITNHLKTSAVLRWVEYWGCQIYQFSFRSFMEAATQQGQVEVVELRRKFGERFAHQFGRVNGNAGLLESKRFLGRDAKEEAAWAKLQAFLRSNPKTLLGGPVEDLANGSAMEDLNPPPTFLVSLDSPADEWSSNGKAFFGEGGVLHPAGLPSRLDGDITATGPESALLVGREVLLAPGERRTLSFAYGYLPEGANLDLLLGKYRRDVSSLWSRSSDSWRKDGLRLTVPSEPWVERELTWHHYYLRSGSTFDDFFGEHIISQGQVYQYAWGFQGAARDPLQYALPMVFSNPGIVREIIRYTLKEVQPDGSLPYGIVGHGVPMSVANRPSDLELWLLWAASEYVLGTRDRAFLEEEVTTYSRGRAKGRKETIRSLLVGRYRYLTETMGSGEHGLLKLLMGDWNDDMVLGFVPPDQVEEVNRHAESVLNAAMAAYVLDYYASMLKYLGDGELAEDAHQKASAQRMAVRAHWAGRWFQRAWLSQQLGWVGDEEVWLEPQPWAILGGAATPDQTRELLQAIDEVVRRPSPIGAMIRNKSIKLEGFELGVFSTGIWPSINGTLIWALAQVDGMMAWDEWKKNTLARHAEVYPEIWYGTWSGPDSYNSVLSKYPGQTFFLDSAELKKGGPSRIFWTDFPVMNMHPHAWPIYDAAKLLGVQFTPRGVGFAPKLPLEECRFESPLLGFHKSSAGYEGWYQPAAPGEWIIRMTLAADEAGRILSARVNGKKQQLGRGVDGSFEVTGVSAPGKPLRWSLENR